ncbi:MAG: hypothetical protein ABI440_06220 [Casimicrobiaceae bacterium]
MNPTLISAGALAALLISGCAAAPMTRASVDGKLVCNQDYMDQVERSAHRQMTEVHWINCPQIQLRAADS